VTAALGCLQATYIKPSISNNLRQVFYLGGAAVKFFLKFSQWFIAIASRVAKISRHLSRSGARHGSRLGPEVL
jgi:hypothetical protein